MNEAFKIWDLNKKEWYKGINGTIMIDNCGNVCLNESQYAKGNFKIIFSIERKDKNGKEIYDGDIINIEYGNNQKDLNVVGISGGLLLSGKQTIKFNNNDTSKGQPANFCLSCITGCSSYEEYGWKDKDPNIEVIGNMYENPELLK